MISRIMKMPFSILASIENGIKYKAKDEDTQRGRGARQPLRAFLPLAALTEGSSAYP